MEPAATEDDTARASAGRALRRRRSCGRAVSIYGRMRRVPCACGETLMNLGREPGPA